jgi:hypothetical protein
MRRVLRPVLTLLVVLLAAAPATQAARGPVSVNVVGGADAASGEVPWQALVYAGDWLCGGSVLDATHVVTAAHCLLDEDDDAIPVDLLEVYAGLTDRDQLGLGQTAPVVSTVLDPAYDAETHTHDAAIITLAAPGFTRADIQPVELTAVGFLPSPLVDMTTSGWGTTAHRPPDGSANHDPLATLLQVATHLRPDDLGCTVYRDYDPALHLCAGNGTAQGNCQGDSGGPLTVPGAGGAPQLAGIVSAAAGCAAGIPALYTRVSEPSIHAFLAARGVGYEGALPALLKAPSVYGETTIGSNVACDEGAWTGASAYAYRWIRSDGALMGLGQALRLKAGDLGATVHCVVTAKGLNGTTPAETPAFTVTQASVPPHQIPAPPDTTPIIPPPPIMPADTTPPTARLRSTRCAHKVCVLEVLVADPEPTSGIKGLDARVATAYRTTCRKGHKRRPCTKTVTKKLTATAVAKGSFRVKTPKLRAGTQTFTIVAIDQAGNRQKVAVKVKRTVR